MKIRDQSKILIRLKNQANQFEDHTITYDPEEQNIKDAIYDFVMNHVKNVNDWHWIEYEDMWFDNPHKMGQKELQPSMFQTSSTLRQKAQDWLDSQKPIEERKKEEEKHNKEIAENWHPDKPSAITDEQMTGLQPTPAGGNSIGDQEAWETRFAAAKERRKQLDEHDREKDARRFPGEKILNDMYNDAVNSWQNKKGIIGVCESIYKTVAFGLHFIGTRLSYLPEDIHDYGIRTVNNVEILGLILEQISDAVLTIMKIWTELDHAGATKMLARIAHEWEDVMENGIKSGLIDKDGKLTTGSQWAVPGVHGPNNDKDLKLWLAAKNLLNMPIVGGIYRSELQIKQLTNYQTQTGVGIPNEDAWINWMLNSGQAGAIPVQDIGEAAGTIPEWFLAGSAIQLKKEIKQHQLKELEEKEKQEEASKRKNTAFGKMNAINEKERRAKLAKMNADKKHHRGGYRPPYW